MRIGLIGFGYWGPNLARNVATSEDAELVAICDSNPDRLEGAHRQYPACRTTSDPGQLFAANDIDAVLIATPVRTHAGLAKAALRSGKHVFVEKPLADSTRSAEEIVELAESLGLKIMVDHTFIYTGAIAKLKDLVDKGVLGPLRYYDSSRLALGLIQSDISVVWDLAIHDLSILDYVTGQRPIAVSATGGTHRPSPQTNTAYITLFYSDDFLAHISVNWLSPVKIRRTLLCGELKMALFDDLEPSDKIKIFDCGYDAVDDPVTVSNPPGVRRRLGDIWIPLVDNREALAAELEAFVRYVRGEVDPPNTGASGLRMVRVLEAVDRSLVDRGRPVAMKGWP